MRGNHTRTTEPTIQSLYPSFTDPIIAQRTAADLEELAFIVRRIGLSNVPNQEIFAIRQVPNRPPGCQGFIAQRDIPEGMSILIEQPLFVINDIGKQLSAVNVTEINTAAVQHPQFLQLSSARNPPSNRSIFETNSYSMGIRRQGIFLLASRMNHSCLPNAYFAWNADLNRLTVHAITPIRAGEEILANYRIDLSYKVSNTRQREFYDQYRFRCDCRACIQAAPFTASSDDRRKSMRLLDTKIDRRTHLVQAQNLPEQEHDLHSILRLLWDEGLVYPYRADACRHLAEWHAGQLEQLTPLVDAQTRNLREEVAIHYARCRLELEVKFTGADSRKVTSALAVIRALRLM